MARNHQFNPRLNQVRVTVGTKAEHKACRGPHPAQTELQTAYKSARLAERTAVGVALQAQVGAGQPEVGFPQESRSHQKVTG